MGRLSKEEIINQIKNYKPPEILHLGNSCFNFTEKDIKAIKLGIKLFKEYSLELNNEFYNCALDAAKEKANITNITIENAFIKIVAEIIDSINNTKYIENKYKFLDVKSMAEGDSMIVNSIDDNIVTLAPQSMETTVVYNKNIITNMNWNVELNRIIDGIHVGYITDIKNLIEYKDNLIYTYEDILAYSFDNINVYLGISGETRIYISEYSNEEELVLSIGSDWDTKIINNSISR